MTGALPWGPQGRVLRLPPGASRPGATGAAAGEAADAGGAGAGELSYAASLQSPALPTPWLPSAGGAGSPSPPASPLLSPAALSFALHTVHVAVPPTPPGSASQSKSPRSGGGSREKQVAHLPC